MKMVRAHERNHRMVLVYITKLTRRGRIDYDKTPGLIVIEEDEFVRDWTPTFYHRVAYA